MCVSVCVLTIHKQIHTHTRALKTLKNTTISNTNRESREKRQRTKVCKSGEMVLWSTRIIKKTSNCVQQLRVFEAKKKRRNNINTTTHIRNNHNNKYKREKSIDKYTLAIERTQIRTHIFIFISFGFYWYIQTIRICRAILDFLLWFFVCSFQLNQNSEKKQIWRNNLIGSNKLPLTNLSRKNLSITQYFEIWRRKKINKNIDKC